ncbi:MAG: AraC family transcriptional regulator [Verrucomicrobia bacterium]|nr:AraC family transcriptional regulator [Verrucomicrobiota bacterium]MBU4247914.1 AraC family transcriptional regulator [Verrucomicrobiota bacterium]MBU4291880.1 AraC family transcriptional regulator [Verrucomicrobiota bacterium]MBU4498355.1 AraC family transcriptional regulator [Verrucomicrobiota bacterium]MCG2679178.1 AraC family transcriptional regulator [Kiritimatiellia bacterium]
MKLQFCFVAQCRQDVPVHRHTHNALELVYYTEGVGQSRVDQRPYDIQRNIFTITPSGIYHDQKNITDMMSICVGMTQSKLEPYQGAWRDPGGILEPALRSLIFELENKRSAHETVCRGLLLEIAGLVHRIAREKGVQPGRKALVTKAIEIIHKKEGRLSVATLADQLYISPDYLRHAFKNHSRHSPIQHILNARIEKAKTLLTGDDLRIKEVADRCGFENTFYFSRFFRKLTGYTPSQYTALMHRESRA